MGLFDSFLSTTTSPEAAPQAPPDNGQIAYNYFLNNGYAPHQAAGIVGNLQGESGQGLNPDAVNRGDGRDGSDSIGIGQWNGPRAQALKDYAASKGTSTSDLTTQLQFLNSELKGSESAANGQLMAAKTPEQAGQAMLAFERPKDWNKPGAHPERAQFAARAYSMYGGTNPSMAQAVPASPARPPSPIQNIPAQAAPLFAPQETAGLQMPPAPQMQPIFFAPRKPIDLAGLRAAFAQPNFYNRG